MSHSTLDSRCSSQIRHVMRDCISASIRHLQTLWCLVSAENGFMAGYKNALVQIPTEHCAICIWTLVWDKVLKRGLWVKLKRTPLVLLSRHSLCLLTEIPTAIWEGALFLCYLSWLTCSCLHWVATNATFAFSSFFLDVPLFLLSKTLQNTLSPLMR